MGAELGHGRKAVPDGWQHARLGEIAGIERGVSWTRRQESSVPVDGSVPVVRIGNVQPDGIHMDDRLYIREVADADKKRRSITPETLVMVGSNGNRNRVGNVFLATPEVVGHVLASFLIGIKPSEAVSERFLAACLRSSLVQSRISEATAGSTGLKNLSLEWLRSLQLGLPPLDEQRRIAAILDAIDASIERTQAAIDAVEHLRKALLQQLLTRGMPGWHTEYKDVPGIGTIPADWEVVRLGEVAEVASGQVSPMDSTYQRHLFVAPDDIESVSGRLLRYRTVAEVAAISGKYLFTPDDVVYSKIRPYLMKVYLPTEAGLCSADMYPIRPGPRLVREQLATVLLSKHCADYVATCSERTGIPKVNRPDLMRYEFALPSVEEQEAIAGVLASLDASTSQTARAGQELRALRSATADALLSGRVRVPVGVEVGS